MYMHCTLIVVVSYTVHTYRDPTNVKHNLSILLVGPSTIWKDVMHMADPVTVDYVIVEDLFCQKKPEASTAKEKKSQPPKEVNYYA